MFRSTNSGLLRQSEEYKRPEGDSRSSPTKTLEVDQVNRFVRHLKAINDSLPAGEKISIGIWDGDTPDHVGRKSLSAAVPVGSYVRGLTCPKCSKKLQINKSNNLVCESEGFEFPWLRATRSKIKQGVDVLITNPEALDFMFVNPDEPLGIS